MSTLPSASVVASSVPTPASASMVASSEVVSLCKVGRGLVMKLVECCVLWVKFWKYQESGFTQIGVASTKFRINYFICVICSVAALNFICQSMQFAGDNHSEFIIISRALQVFLVFATARRHIPHCSSYGSLAHDTFPVLSFSGRTCWPHSHIG